MPSASQISQLARRAIAAGFPIGSTDFNKFVQSQGRTSGFPLVRSSGMGVGSTFIGGNPIDAFGTDASGRPLPSAKARDVLNAEAAAAQEFEPELLEVTKSDPIQDAVDEALAQSRTDAAGRRARFENFNRTADRFAEQSQADIDRDANETFSTDALRDFLSKENQRFETSTQDLARRSNQFLRKRLDEQLLGGAGAGAPIGDSTDLRNRTMQAFLDVNLPLQQQLSDRRIQQAQQLKGLDISLAGRSQAARAALLNQLTLPFQLGQQVEGNDLLSLARLQAIDDANKFRGVQADVPNDFRGLGSFNISTPSVQSGRVSSQPLNTAFRFDANNSTQPQSQVIRPSASVTNNQVDRQGFPIEWNLGGQQSSGRRIASPAETSRMRRATRQIDPNSFGSVSSRIGTTGIVNDGTGYFSVP